MPIASARRSISSSRCSPGWFVTARVSARRRSAPRRPASIGPTWRRPGEKREKSRAIAALGRDREVVALEQAQREREARHGAARGRHGDDAIEIGIAGENSGGVGEHQRVDPRRRIGAAEARDQRRCEQHVAEPAQRHHQNARTRRQASEASGVSTEVPDTDVPDPAVMGAASLRPARRLYPLGVRGAAPCRRTRRRRTRRATLA